MDTYLLAWNPKRWDWKTLADDCETVARGGSARRPWSCGNSKGILVGSRFFLVRLGSDPKGIVGAGRIASSPYEDSHWDPTREKRGDKALYVDVDFESLARNPLIRWAELQNPPLAGFPWATRMSGIMIRPPYVQELEKRWSLMLGRSEVTIAEEISGEADFYEGSLRQIQVNAYERDRTARDACIRHYGAKCFVCGFNFENVYGQIGTGYIHVHHLVPLSQIRREYSVDPIRDLRPVCPNCHAMIHLRGRPFTLEDVQRFIEEARVDGSDKLAN